MASPRPKSPKTPVSKNEGESFWDKIGTIGRKKRIKEGKRWKVKFWPINEWLCRFDVWLNTVFTLYGMNEFFFRKFECFDYFDQAMGLSFGIFSVFQTFCQ